MLWLLLVYFLFAAVLTSSVLLLTHRLGRHHDERATHDPYESGVLPTGSARLRLAAEFYLVAMFFVIFDLESVFIFAWAVAVRELKWVGYFEILVFVVVLVATLYYLWRVGGLDWRTERQKQALARRRRAAG